MNTKSTQFRVDIRPLVGTMANPSVPPEIEVREGRYHYIPCPIDEPPMPSNVFMHYFTSAANVHNTNLWGSRLPQKLGASLFFSNEPLSTGWGILIVEGPNWFLFWTAMIICLVVNGLLIGLYSRFRNDNPSGVAIGSYLLSIQAMGLTAMFYKWR